MARDAARDRASPLPPPLPPRPASVAGPRAAVFQGRSPRPAGPVGSQCSRPPGRGALPEGSGGLLRPPPPGLCTPSAKFGQGPVSELGIDSPNGLYSGGETENEVCKYLTAVATVRKTRMQGGIAEGDGQGGRPHRE